MVSGWAGASSSDTYSHPFLTGTSTSGAPAYNNATPSMNPGQRASQFSHRRITYDGNALLSKVIPPVVTQVSAPRSSNPQATRVRSQQHTVARPDGSIPTFLPSMPPEMRGHVSNRPAEREALKNTYAYDGANATHRDVTAFHESGAAGAVCEDPFFIKSIQELKRMLHASSRRSKRHGGRGSYVPSVTHSLYPTARGVAGGSYERSQFCSQDNDFVRDRGSYVPASVAPTDYSERFSPKILDFFVDRITSLEKQFTDLANENKELKRDNQLLRLNGRMNPSEASTPIMPTNEIQPSFSSDYANQSTLNLQQIRPPENREEYGSNTKSPATGKSNYSLQTEALTIPPSLIKKLNDSYAKIESTVRNVNDIYSPKAHEELLRAMRESSEQECLDVRNVLSPSNKSLDNVQANRLEVLKSKMEHATGKIAHGSSGIYKLKEKVNEVERVIQQKKQGTGIQMGSSDGAKLSRVEYQARLEAFKEILGKQAKLQLHIDQDCESRNQWLKDAEARINKPVMQISLESSSDSGLQAAFKTSAETTRGTLLSVAVGAPPVDVGDDIKTGVPVSRVTLDSSEIKNGTDTFYSNKNSAVFNSVKPGVELSEEKPIFYIANSEQGEMHHNEESNLTYMQNYDVVMNKLLGGGREEETEGPAAQSVDKEINAAEPVAPLTHNLNDISERPSESNHAKLVELSVTEHKATFFDRNIEASSVYGGGSTVGGPVPLIKTAVRKSWDDGGSTCNDSLWTERGYGEDTHYSNHYFSANTLNSVWAAVPSTYSSTTGPASAESGRWDANADTVMQGHKDLSNIFSNSSFASHYSNGIEPQAAHDSGVIEQGIFAAISSSSKHEQHSTTATPLTKLFD